MVNADAWTIVIAGLAPTAAVAGVGYLLRRVIGNMDARMDRQDGRMDRQEDRIEEIENTCVTKEEWLREAGASRQRLDNIAEGIARLEGKQDQGVEIAAAIAAAFNSRDRKP